MILISQLYEAVQVDLEKEKIYISSGEDIRILKILKIKIPI